MSRPLVVRRENAALRHEVFFPLTPTFVRCPRQSVGRLPRSVVVERRATLAVITCGVVSAHTLPMDLRERREREERELISNEP